MKSLKMEHRGRVAIVTLDDPARRNALSLSLSEELTACVESLASDPGTGAVVLSGTAPAFCAGADLSELGSSRREGLERIYAGFLAVAASPLPTVAAVNGPAVGAGMNLALACDVRIAGGSARFDTRFVELGIHPGGGHTWMLRRAVGAQNAAALTLFGEVVDGPEAARIGLVWRCVDDADLLSTAVALATRAADAPRGLTQSVKRTLARMASVEDHADAVAVELEAQLTSMEDPAFAAGLEAVRRKVRTPSDRPVPPDAASTPPR